MTTSKDIGLSYARQAGADLSTALNKFASLDSSGNVVLASDNGLVLGTIIEEAPSGHPVTVQYGGQGKVICSGTIAAGAQIASAAGGLAKTSTGTNPIGIALEGGVINSVIEFAFAM
jgi:hypothetical protein